MGLMLAAANSKIESLPLTGWKVRTNHQGCLLFSTHVLWQSHAHTRTLMHIYTHTHEMGEEGGTETERKRNTQRKKQMVLKGEWCPMIFRVLGDLDRLGLPQHRQRTLERLRTVLRVP